MCVGQTKDTIFVENPQTKIVFVISARHLFVFVLFQNSTVFLVCLQLIRLPSLSFLGGFFAFFFFFLGHNKSSPVVAQRHVVL